MSGMRKKKKVSQSFCHSFLLAQIFWFKPKQKLFFNSINEQRKESVLQNDKVLVLPTFLSISPPKH